MCGPIRARRTVLDCDRPRGANAAVIQCDKFSKCSRVTNRVLVNVVHFFVVRMANYSVKSALKRKLEQLRILENMANYSVKCAL